MIYATIDVTLQGHPKAIKAGAAMYLWTYAMLWSRDQRESGFVPREVALRCAWAPQAENERAAKALVASGLWLEAEGGWDIWNYPQKNDTRDQIEKRIATTRDRQSRYRESKGARDAEATRDKRVAPGVGARAGVGADVVTDPEGVQGEGVPEAPSAIRLRAAPPMDDRPTTPPPPDIEVTPEIEAQCVTAGARKPTRADVVAMLNDRRKRGRKFVDWGAELVTWMINQKGMDARDRERERERQQRPGGPLIQSAVERGWEVPEAAKGHGT